MNEILRKLNRLKLSFMAHPDYVMHDSGEFHDNVSTIEEIEKLVNSCLDGVVGQSEQLADKGRYCNDCGDYVGKGCDNLGCRDFKG